MAVFRLNDPALNPRFAKDFRIVPNVRELGAQFGVFGGNTPPVPADPRVQNIVAAGENRNPLRVFVDTFFRNLATNLTAKFADTPEGRRLIEEEKKRQIGKFVGSPVGIVVLVGAGILIFLLARR